jgi:poly-gamma-glutamate system protein
MYTSPRLRTALVALAAVAALLYGLAWLATGGAGLQDEQKLQAAQTVLAGEQAILAARGIPPAADTITHDSLQAALLGPHTSVITTDAGSLRSKLTATNPNFAAAIVDMLRDADVGAGDSVAIAYTGSFPALDLATIAATEALGAEPIVVSSVGASNWGATDPSFTILDMESVLLEQGLIHHRSVASAIGGSLKRQPMSEPGRQAALAAMSRNGVPPLDARSLRGSVSQRQRIYTAAANGGRVKAFINVGGGQVSTGGASFRDHFVPGLSIGEEDTQDDGKGLLAAMQRAGVPTIHLDEVVTLAERLQLPVAPTATPSVGEGGPYRDWGRIRLVAAVAAAILVVAMLGVRFLVLAPADEHAFDALSGTTAARYRRRLRPAA